MILTLPTHLVHDILLNLPLKSLTRFKSVSKACQSLIENSSFVELHRARSKKHSQLLIQIRNDYDSSIIILSPEDGFNGGVALHKVRIPWATLARMLNPINGLFCFINMFNDATCIYNLATRQVTPWAQTSINIGSPCLFGIIRHGCVTQQPIYGFGFDPSTNNHKLLRVWQIRRTTTNVWEYACEVFTVGENQWRKIDEAPPVVKLADESDGVYANGSIYFRNASAKGFLQSPDTELIVAFDVGTEKFRVIEIPDFILDNSLKTSSSGRCLVGGYLLQIDGHIALVDIVNVARENEHVEKLWICDDNKKMMKTNWTEETILLPFSYDGGCCLYPVEGTTEIVIKIPDNSSSLHERSLTLGCLSLYVYERIKKNFRKIDVTGIWFKVMRPFRYELFIYHESLLPIHQKPVKEQNLDRRRNTADHLKMDEDTSEIVEMDFEYY